MLKSDEFTAARRRIAAAYDPQLVRGAGHRLIDQLSEHFEEVQASKNEVLPWRHPAENIADAGHALDGVETPSGDAEGVVERFSELVRLMLARGHNLHDPRYIGHQVPASTPLAGLFDAVGAITNQPMAIYDMGPWATAAEYALVERLGQIIGWPAGSFAGLVTHGGSLANLTALLAARNVRFPDSWRDGLRPGPDGSLPVVVVHNDAHYCVARAAGVLGLGTAQIVRVGLDAERRMDPQQLADTLEELRKERREVLAVVACSCSTPVGAFDPLEEIAELCREYDVWLHVDAAHGGSACMSERHRHLVSGLEQADSLVWDAHKMLFMPALCAFVFFRNRTHRFEAFRQEAPYLFDPTAPGMAEYDGGMRTVECTKRAAAFGLWGTWSLHGRQLFADMVDVAFELGQIFHQKLLNAPDFEPLFRPQCNIVVYRHLPEPLCDASPEKIGEFQMALRRRIIESGEFYIVSTKVDGIGALRSTVINPLTTGETFDQLLDALRRHGRAILGS